MFGNQAGRGRSQAEAELKECGGGGGGGGDWLMAVLCLKALLAQGAGTTPGWLVLPEPPQLSAQTMGTLIGKNGSQKMRYRSENAPLSSVERAHMEK